MTISFFLPVIPRTKKNHTIRTKQGYQIPSKAYLQFEKDCLMVIPGDLRQLHLDKPCNVCTIFYMPTRRKVDLPNLHNAVDDMLVKGGVFLDDNRDIIAGHDGSRVYHRPEKPGVEITITLINEPYEQWKKIGVNE